MNEFTRNIGWSVGHWKKTYYPKSFKAFLWRQFWKYNTPHVGNKRPWRAKFFKMLLSLNK